MPKVTGTDAEDIGALSLNENLADLTNTSSARNNLGLGTLATQSSDSVDITGGDATLSTLTVGDNTIDDFLISTDPKSNSDDVSVSAGYVNTQLKLIDGGSL